MNVEMRRRSLLESTQNVTVEEHNTSQKPKYPIKGR